jgi:TonB-linked SusC/RagA family outer membrane protein
MKSLFNIVGKFIAITLFLGISSNIFGQELKITGQVTDSQGQPLPGVTVILQGTTKGTITDAGGKYALQNVSPKQTLEFSFVGMQKNIVQVGSRSVIDVTMKESATGLNEVVVVGFGTQKKADLTGAVGTVDAKSLEQIPVQNAVQALQGLVPGLNITQSAGGNLENTPSINIRGTGTIGQGSTGSPLILIDGTEGDINSINPQDIDNISVLKDAAACSIYGSRAAFGVILVTTKKGKVGRTTVNYNNSFRSSSPLNLPQMMDSYTFANYFNAASQNSGSGLIFAADQMQRIEDYQSGKLKTGIIPNPSNSQYWADGYAYGNANTDWYKEVYKSSAPSQEHEISVNGGNENVTYYLSGDYLNETGLMRFGGDNFQRYNLTSNITVKLSPIASFSYNMKFIRSDEAQPSAETSSLNQDLARQGWPTLPVYDPNGYLYSSPSPALGLQDGGRTQNQDDATYHQFQILLTPLHGWTIHADLNYRIYSNLIHDDYQATYNHDVSGNAYVYNSYTDVHEETYGENYFNPNIYSDYVKKINENNFKLMVGYQSEIDYTKWFEVDRQGIIIPSISVLDATSGMDYSNTAQPPVVEGNNQQWATEGFFGRFNYDYAGKYLFEANLRYDGTSRYQANNRWNLFPSFSAGWNIAKESFWVPLQKEVNELKIRGSYGELGNQNTSNWYPTYQTMPISSASGAWLINNQEPNIAWAPGLISSDLTWERVKTWDAGIDLGALNNRLTASYDYYIRYTNDMVGPAPELPITLGTDVPSENNTNLKTSGFELNVGWRDHLENGFNYSINLLLSDSKTFITKYPNPTGDLSTYRAGEQLGEIWGYQTIGIAQTQAQMDSHLASLPNGGQSSIGSNWAAGDIMYADLNHDGKIDDGAYTLADHGDLKIIGNNTPRYNFGINLAADWKGFDFRAFFQGTLKRDYWQGSSYFWGAWSWGEWWSTGLKQQENYFRNSPTDPEGVNLNSYYPRPLFGDGKDQQTQTRYLQNASYIRLKNLQFGYTIPELITKKVGIQKLRFFVSGENLWTGTKLAKMFDPETISGGASVNGSNNGNVYPLSETLSCGLSVTF